LFMMRKVHRLRMKSRIVRDEKREGKRKKKGVGRLGDECRAVDVDR